MLHKTKCHAIPECDDEPPLDSMGDMLGGCHGDLLGGHYLVHDLTSFEHLYSQCSSGNTGLLRLALSIPNHSYIILIIHSYIIPSYISHIDASYIYIKVQTDKTGRNALPCYLICYDS